MKDIKFIIEKHADGYVAYPLGLKGIVVGQGDTYEEAVSDVKSAVQFHIETFGSDMLNPDPPVLKQEIREMNLWKLLNMQNSFVV